MTNKCAWVQEEEDSDTWATDCGHYFELNEGKPSENEMGFCCYCGKPLEELPFESEDDED